MGFSRSRRSWLIIAGLLLILPLVVVGSVYRRQIASYVTHLGGSPTKTWPLEPFAAGDEPLKRFVAVGDVGKGSDRERRTAEAIARAAGDEPYDALLLLGDNVYPDGDPALVDDRVLDPFEPVLSQGTELYAILGNHDVATERGDEMVAELGMEGRWWAHVFGDVLVVGLDSTIPNDDAQRRWLEQTLEASRERWKIVMLHHPPYSAGYQGSSLSARAAFESLFEAHGVQLVLSGHEHDYQRTVPIKGVTYIVSGAAAETRRTGRADFTAAAFSWHHFVEINVLVNRMVVRAVNQDGRVFDEVTVYAG